MVRVVPTPRQGHAALDRWDSGGKCGSGDQVVWVLEQGQRVRGDMGEGRQRRTEKETDLGLCFALGCLRCTY